MKKLMTVVICAALLFACGSDPLAPEQQVRNTLDAMQEAAEARSLSDFMTHISDDYSDHQGNDKAAIRRIVQLLFLRNQSINIFTRIQSLDINNDFAAVELSAAMAARGVDLTQESNRLKADTHRFSVVLQQTSGDADWLVQSVSWKRGWGG